MFYRREQTKGKQIVTLRILWHKILLDIWHNGELFGRASWTWTNSHPCRNRRRSRFQDLHSALIAESMLSSASDRTRVGAALWRIQVENLTKRRDKRVGVLRAGECGNAVDEKEGHAVQSS